MKDLIREEDGYVNANALCKTGGKRFRTWKENKKVNKF